MHQKRSILAISGGRFIFEFFPPEFLEKYFQTKRSPNSPAPMKKSKKSRPGDIPLINQQLDHLKSQFLFYEYNKFDDDLMNTIGSMTQVWSLSLILCFDSFLELCL